MNKFCCILTLAIVLSVYCDDSKDPNAEVDRTIVIPCRRVIVQLFEWKWTDIALECERFLGPKGFAGVQVSPPNEHAVINNPYRPWWERYQPVSYKLDSRSGNEQQFIDMVQRCNAVGVRVYVVAVINHMSSYNGIGSANSTFNSINKSYAGLYSQFDFNDAKCKSKKGLVEDYQNIQEVRDCKLLGLPDLSLNTEYVRGKVVGYLNRLIDVGVAGFRIDAAKHIWPVDLLTIVKNLKNLREDLFGTGKRPFVYSEVSDFGNEPIKATEYTNIGRVTEYKYGKELSEVVNRQRTSTYNEQKLAYLKNFGTAWGLLPDNDALVAIDNQDSQRDNGPGRPVLTHFESRNYKIAIAFMLAWPYGFPLLMSSYNFQRTNFNQGPPSNDDGETKSVTINDDGTCGDGWICEHRWRQITNMVMFRNIVGTENVTNWWDNGENQIAFSRGFFAINNDKFSMNLKLQTGLETGVYCDIISGNKVNGTCTGRQINVNSDGTSQILIDYYSEDPVIAIHAQSRL